jgi:hypothetical protein
VGAEKVFPRSLEKTYHEKGFFNVQRQWDHLVADGGEVTLILRGGRRIMARVDRNANNNKTARIYGGAALRDWFQENYNVGDIVSIRFDTPRQLSLG